jgi:two-component system, OmpR family, sensor histidine kinase KdpD
MKTSDKSSFVTKGSIGIWQTIAHSALGCLVLGALTYGCYRLHSNLATTGFLCLIVVVLLSFFGDLISATALSIAAVVYLDYFFAPPILSLRISDPLNVLALITFLTTALAITYLMTRVRFERRSSELQRKEMRRLYELAQQLLALSPEEIHPQWLLAIFRNVFALRAICLIETETLASHLSGDSQYDLETWTRIGHTTVRDRDDFDRSISVRNLRVAGQVIGVLSLEGLAHQELTADALAALAAAMLERVRAFRAAARAEAAAQTEHLRSTLLDALAHDVKTPLATILAATGGLRETSGLDLNQLDFVNIVESESVRLGRITTRLFHMAQLDREEVRPQLQQVDIANLIAEELSQKSQQFADHKLSLVEKRDREKGYIEADPELLRLALAQLIENACKYSQPGSKVEVSALANEDSVAIRVRNHSYIPIEEQSKIFERFYRGKQSRNSISGTGLGLDIARRILIAHGGTLALENSNQDGSIFCMTIPVVGKEA